MIATFHVLSRFKKRDYAAAERFWSPNYIQHSAHIPGHEGLFNLVRSVPETMRHENQFFGAGGDYVIAHGRFRGIGRPAAWIAADVIRFEDGVLREHWDVLQDEDQGRICQQPSHVWRHIPQATAENNAIVLRAFDTLFSKSRRHQL
ncbi:MAG: nuclear transport factor 2 family protein [Candidatus Sulfotelmatobacter sp.]